MILRHFAPVLSLKAFSVKVSFRKLHASKASAIFIITRREFRIDAKILFRWSQLCQEIKEKVVGHYEKPLNFADNAWLAMALALRMYSIVKTRRR